MAKHRMFRMVSKCANPACKTEFKYFREGKLFEFDTAPEQCASTGEARRLPRHRTLYWLCSGCATKMTLTCRDGLGVVVVPLRSQSRRAA